jgi:hypothetical protein
MALEKEISVGPEGKLDIKIEGGKIIIAAIDEHASGSVKLEISEDLKYFLEKLKPHLPEWAQVVISAGEAALP